MIYEHEHDHAWPGIVEGLDPVGSERFRAASLAGNLYRRLAAADSVPAMITARATAVIAGPNGRREAPVEAIVTGPGGPRSKGASSLSDSMCKAKPADAIFASSADGNGHRRRGCRGQRHARRQRRVHRVVRNGANGTDTVIAEAGAALIGHKLDNETPKSDAAAGRACKPIDDKRHDRMPGQGRRRLDARPAIATNALQALGTAMAKTRVSTIIAQAVEVPLRAATDPRRVNARAQPDGQQGRMRLGRLRPAVILDGKIVCSCLMRSRAEGLNPDLEGIAQGDKLHGGRNSSSVRRCNAASARRDSSSRGGATRALNPTEEETLLAASLAAAVYRL
jgi:CO/xanthine dehydrogenase FAD-binding subunit